MMACDRPLESGYAKVRVDACKGVYSNCEEVNDVIRRGIHGIWEREYSYIVESFQTNLLPPGLD